MTVSTRTRSRLVMVTVAVLFLASFGVAAALFFGGWRPAQTRNIGQMLDPYPDLRGIALQRADGTAFDWAPLERRWHVIVAPPADCGTTCAELLDALRRVWISEGRHADRLKVLWAGELPAGIEPFAGLVPLRANDALQAALPDRARADALPVYLADPNGWLVLRYPPGFDPSGLRKDLGRLLK